MRGSIRAMFSIAVAIVVAAALVAPPVAVAASATGKNVQLPVGLSVSGIVMDTHGNPVAGASVGLCSSVDNCFDGGDGVSEADGTFTIQPVPDGSYLLQALAPEGTNLFGAWDIGMPGGSQDPADAVSIVVAANVAGREIHLADGLRITGLVKSPEGDPVPGAWVSADGPVSGSSVASNVDGHYQVVGLTPGTYTLRVYGPDGSDFPSGVVVDGIVVAEDSEVVPTGYEVVAADLTDQDITLSRGRSISGTLVGATGKLVEVRALDASTSVLFPVDADGEFKVRGLYPGSYHLQFTVPESLGGNFPYGNYNGPGEVLVDQSTEGVAIDTTAGDVSGLQAALPVLPTLSGTVRDVAGPVANAMLNACDPDLGCARAVTGADGTWTVRNVPPGSYEIQAGAAHHVVIGYAAGRSNPDPYATIPVKVGTTSVGGVAIVLPLGNTISGRVTGPGGVPLAGIGVFAGLSSGGIWEFGPGGVETDANGNFTVSGLVSGSYKLSIDPPLGSPYRSGYWSGAGYTADWEDAALIPISDQTLPSVGPPGVSIHLGGILGRTSVPVEVRWSATDAGSNVKANRLQQQTNGGSWVTVSSPVTPSVIRALTASSTRTYRFRSRATDYAANSSTDRPGSTFRVLLSQQSSPAVAWRGTWKTVRATGASGGSYRATTARGASATFAFTGRAVAWVAMRGTGLGKASVSVDGATPVIIDLRAGSTQNRRIVFSKSWTTSARHTVKITCLGTANRPRVDIDAFTVIR